MELRSLQVLIFGLCHFFSSACLVCTDTRRLPQFTDNVMAASEPFRTFEDIGPLTCVKECLLRAHCGNISYNTTTATCALHKSDAVIAEGQENGEVFSSVTSWPQRMAGECAHHDCPLDTICQAHENGYVCYTPQCPPPNSVKDSDPLFEENNALNYSVGDVVEYRCHDGHLPDGKRQCREDETWSRFKCRKLHYCYQLPDCNSSYTGGEYWLFRGNNRGSTGKVYCINKAGKWTPYVSLLENYTSVVAGPPDQCQANKSDTVVSGQQNISKIIVPHMKVSSYVNNMFHDGNGKYQPLITGDCSNEKAICDVGRSFFKLNLSGTGFIVDVVGEWVVSGEGYINVTVSEDHRIIEGTCKGRCVVCYLDGTVKLKVDPAYTPPFESAIMPVCDHNQ